MGRRTTRETRALLQGRARSGVRLVTLYRRALLDLFLVLAWAVVIAVSHDWLPLLGAP